MFTSRLMHWSRLLPAQSPEFTRARVTEPSGLMVNFSGRESGTSRPRSRSPRTQRFTEALFPTMVSMMKDEGPPVDAAGVGSGVGAGVGAGVSSGVSSGFGVGVTRSGVGRGVSAAACSASSMYRRARLAQRPVGNRSRYRSQAETLGRRPAVSHASWSGSAGVASAAGGAVGSGAAVGSGVSDGSGIRSPVGSSPGSSGVTSSPGTGLTGGSGVLSTTGGSPSSARAWSAQGPSGRASR